jgi:hypothetical protein
MRMILIGLASLLFVACRTAPPRCDDHLSPINAPAKPLAAADDSAPSKESAAAAPVSVSAP